MKTNQNGLVVAFIFAVAIVISLAISALSFPTPGMSLYVGNFQGDGGGLTNLPVAGTNGGTVTSVAMTVPGGLSVSGSPITVSGTFGMTAANTAGFWNNNGAGVTSWGALSGIITSSGFVTSFGTFSSATLAAALTDGTGSGANVFGTGPTISSPIISSATASTLADFSAGKVLQSIANGLGALTNDNAGNFGWFNGFGSGGTITTQTNGVQLATGQTTLNINAGQT